MSRLGAALADRSALQLRWSKYSRAYQNRLLEGGKALRLFLDRKSIGWRTVLRASARQVDEILEAFVKERHDTEG